MERSRYLGKGLILLVLTLVVGGCQAAADSPIDPYAATPEGSIAPEAVEASQPGEAEDKSEPQVAVARIGYQEGFTERGDPFRGDQAAPVVIEEFSSYQCYFCGLYFRETYPQVIANYVETGQVRYIFRDFPLPSQPQSPLAAEAANCAGQTSGGSAYWAMHDRLFERQADWSGNRDAAAIFKGYAADLGLDEAALGECLDSGTTRAHIEADTIEGGARGVRGTPTFFINGQALVGAQPYVAFVQVIEAELADEPPG